MGGVDSANSAVPCIPGCGRIGPSTLYPYLGSPAALVPVAGVNQPMSAHTTLATAVPLRIQGSQAFNDGCGNSAAQAIGRIWASAYGGPGSLTYEAGGVIRSNGAGSSELTLTFDCPVDLILRPQSFQGVIAPEQMQVLAPTPTVDEYYAGPGSNQGPSREDLPVPLTYRDNQGPSMLIWRQTMGPIVIRPRGENAATEAIEVFVHQASVGVIPVRCEAFVSPEGCTPTTTPRWRMGCASTTLAPSLGVFGWTDGGTAAPWQYSSDSGGSYVTATPAAPVTNGDADEQHRWRQTFNIPVGYHGYLAWTQRETPATFDGRMYLDDVLASDNQKSGAAAVAAGPGWSSGWVVLTPGAHTFEYRAGAVTVDGVRSPNISLRMSAARADSTDVQIVECLNAAGAVASSYLLTADGNPFVLGGNQTLNEGRCSGCQ